MLARVIAVVIPNRDHIRDPVERIANLLKILIVMQAFNSLAIIMLWFR